MSRFDDFEQMYGPPRDCEPADEETIRELGKLLPAQLVDHWRETGWCAWGDGLIWSVNPKEFDDVVEDLLDFESGRAVVFLRTAFAHLYLWHEGYAYSLDVHHGSISQVTQDVDLLFTLLCDTDIREQILRADLYEEVKQRLGPPNREECYAFVPALALGGPGTADTVQRVKLREHLGLLAQLVQR
jgi:hypothetical protein